MREDVFVKRIYIVCCGVSSASDESNAWTQSLFPKYIVVLRQDYKKGQQKILNPHFAIKHVNKPGRHL
jgi:hypothetical protein